MILNNKICYNGIKNEINEKYVADFFGD